MKLSFLFQYSAHLNKGIRGVFIHVEASDCDFNSLVLFWCIGDHLSSPVQHKWRNGHTQTLAEAFSKLVTLGKHLNCVLIWTILFYLLQAKKNI